MNEAWRHRLTGPWTGACAQAAGALALIGMLAAAPAGAKAVLLVPVGVHANLAGAFDLVADSEARVLTAGPLAGTLIATNTPALRSRSLRAGYVAIGWSRPACGDRA